MFVVLRDEPVLAAIAVFFLERVRGDWKLRLLCVTGDAAFVTVISADGTKVLYSTYLGGTQSDGGVPLPTNPFHALPNANVETIGVNVAVGADGTLYVVGETNTIDMPVTSGAAQPIIGGETDGFIARIKADTAGHAGLMYLTYLGGLTNDFCSAVAIDNAGNAFVTGETQSLNFPVMLGAFQLVHAPGTAGFVTKLNPDGTKFIYSTLLSGSKGSSAHGRDTLVRSACSRVGGTGCCDLACARGDASIATQRHAVYGTGRILRRIARNC